ncbi:MAG TPA: XdhC/CoxI family protein, partial [Acidimicrobiales bacterium]|nr:XdhC/CoxI family protein [Acidimicrobiales bacterium]
MTTLYEALRDALRDDVPVALATIIRLGSDDEGASVPDELHLGAKLLIREGHEPIGSIGNGGLDHAVARDLRAALTLGGTTERHYGFRGEPHSAVTVFIEVFAPRARMVIFGAMDFTAALARLAKMLGYHVTICDARPVFATTARFPMADEVVVDWPHRYLESIGDELSARDALCILTHDPKFDVPAIVAALGTAVGYIGAMGSRRTVADR